MIALHRQSIRSSIRTVTLVAALTSLLLAMVTPFVGVAEATLPGSSFDATDATVDTGGNIMKLPDSCPAIDDADHNGPDDGPINGSSTKLNVVHLDDPPTINPDLNHPGHSDLCNIWIGSEIANGQFLLYLAWERDASGGSSGAYWEFQHSALACTTAASDCNPFANRAAGDFIVHFDFQGNSLDDITIREFDGSTFGTGINPADYLPDPAGEASSADDRLFGEAVLNLTELEILDPNSDVCETFAGVIPGSATGNSDTSDYKDIVLTSVQPNITNCGTVVVQKVSTTGDDYGDTFDITLSDDGGDIREESLGHGESFTENDVFSGTDYDVSEDVPDGWTLDGIACALEDGTPTGTDGQDFEVIATETTTCVVTNTPDLPTIELQKTVVNDDGGSAVEGDFQGSIGGVGDVDWDDAVEVDPGDYTADETNLDGYTAGDWGGACDADGDVSVGLGDHVVCTITNDDQPASLTITKVVHNDNGGSATEDDFAPTVDYTGTGDASGVTTSPDWGTYSSVPAGTYTVGETDAAPSSLLADGDYILTGIVCDGEDTDMITLPNGGSGECVVHNTDVPSGLTVIKVVHNDHGGTLGASAFPLTVNGETVTTGIAESFPAGDYTVAELQQDGYELLDVYCTRDGEDVDGISGEEFDISVGLNETVVCTFENQDIPARVTLVKTVTNDDGGVLLAEDFPVTLDGDEAAWDTEYEVDAGSHTVGETQQDGYATEGWGTDCTSGEDPTAGSFDAELDTDYTCTITNDDIAPTVVLRKTVVNDDGGTLTQDDFPVTLDGDEAACDETITTTAGDHSAAETTQPGYLAGEWGGDCAADGSLTAELAGSYECTITNDDIAPGLTVVKEVVNDDGGTAEVGDFPLTVTPDGGEATTVTSGSENFVDAGTYTISEVQQPGYALVSITCDNGVSSSEDTLDVTVGLDESVLCTIVNDDLPISIDLIKVADTDEIDYVPGGDDEVITYTYTITNTGELTLTDLTLVDDVLGDLEVDVDELAPGETTFVTAEHVVTEADADNGEVVNVAVVTGTSPDGRTADDTDDEEVVVNPVEVLPNVIVKPAPVLPATGADTMRLALWAALVAGLGLMFLLATEEAEFSRRRRED